MNYEGYVYILQNGYVPNLVKIGYTNRSVRERAQELSSHTGVPGKWIEHKSWYVQDAAYWEEVVFTALAQHRETGEFFRLDPNTATQMVFSLLLQRGAVDAEGVSPLERARLKSRQAARLTQEEQERREEARVRRVTDQWERGWAQHIEPWCRLMKSCQEIRATFEPPGLISRLWRGEQDVLLSMKKWPGYQKLIAQLPNAFALSRVARKFRAEVTRKNSFVYRGKTVWGDPEGWETAYPCHRKGAQGHFAWLFFLSRDELSADRAAAAMLEVRLVVQDVFGFDGETATRLLSIEHEVRTRLMNLATQESPPELLVKDSISGRPQI